MRKTIVMLAVALTLVLGMEAVPPGQAARLKGFLAFVWHRVDSGTARLIVYDINSMPCGLARLPNVNGDVGQQLALRINAQVLIQQPPGATPHQGVWFTDTPGQTGICPLPGGFPTLGDLDAYYLR
jgi:hypothetical protein